MSVCAQTGVKGTLVDARSGRPVADANILLSDQAIFVTSGADGVFTISNAAPGKDVIEIIASGYEDAFIDIDLPDGVIYNVGDIKLSPAGFQTSPLDSENYLFDEEELMDDDALGQSVGTIQGATDDIYFQAANYDFSIMRFRLRGLDSNWTKGYVNGFEFNDAMRGRFNYSMFGGMTSSAFRNRTTDIAMDASSFGFGSLGGANNYTTYASEYAPGWRGNLSYTNSNYMLRAMLQYATGLNRHGWAFAMSVIGRYAPEGVIEGTFYNSFGLSLSLQKVFNDRHSLNISAWGAPTQRATNQAATQEAYDLAGSNLYNPSWGYLDGKKKSARIVESFDPSVLLNWIWKPRMGTTLNTGFGFRSSNYSSSAIQYYQTPDPKPDYYQYLPSYYAPSVDPVLYPEIYEQQLQNQQAVADWWGGDKANRQIDWNNIYHTNYMNAIQYDRDPELIGQSSYILENRHSNFNSWMLNSYLNHRFSDIVTFQAGLSFNYTDAHYYKTVRDLLGGQYWRDIDNFSERDFVGDVNIMQNDLRYPNRRVTEGDIFGYDYNIRDFIGRAWAQAQISTRHWDAFASIEASFTNFMRHGNMQNGRAPENSLGNGQNHSFGNAAAKLGATYKLNGRNYFSAHISGGSRAPQPNDAYVSPRTKDDAVSGLQSEKFFSADLSYTWNYRRFRGSVTGFYTHLWGGMKRLIFFDYDLFSSMNYSLSDVESEFKGVELGLEYKILHNLSISGAATFARYQYKNNPMGTRSYENGSADDIVRQTYLKNYYIGGSPQQVYSLALNYNIKQWFFEVNGQWFGDNYFELSPLRHEQMPGLWKLCLTEDEYIAKQKEITHQDKLNNAFVMNLSVGKVLYTKFGSVNFNLSINNLLNNREIQTGGWQEGKFDYTNYNVNKFPNKIYYAQGIRIFFNVGIRF